MRLLYSVIILIFLFVSVQYSSQEDSMKFINKSYNLVSKNPYLAGQELKKAIEASPEWDYPYILLADLYDANYIVGKAIELYEKAIKIGITQNAFKFKIYFLTAGQ